MAVSGGPCVTGKSTKILDRLRFLGEDDGELVGSTTASFGDAAFGGCSRTRHVDARAQRTDPGTVRSSRHRKRSDTFGSGGVLYVWAIPMEWHHPCSSSKRPRSRRGRIGRSSGSTAGDRLLLDAGRRSSPTPPRPLRRVPQAAPRDVEQALVHARIASAGGPAAVHDEDGAGDERGGVGHGVDRAPATSVVVPTRPTGIRSSTSARKSGRLRRSAVPGVRTNVGATQFTVTPEGPTRAPGPA